MERLNLSELHCILKIDAILGESPVWSTKEHVLYWVDIVSCTINRFDPRSNENRGLKLKQPVTALGLCENGQMILALKNGIALFNPLSQLLNMIAKPEQDMPYNRFNEGRCDRQGRFWCGTMNQVDMTKDTGNLYRVDTHYKVARMQDHVILTNGMGWSPDNRTMYFTETLRYTIFAYDFEPTTGEISNRRPFVKIDPYSYPIGGPDGLTVDSEGFVWSAHYGAGKIVRYDPDGHIIQEIILPAPHVTSCTFGGENLDTLYITTARENMNEKQISQFPLSGSLFAIKPGVQGIPESFYKG